MKLSQFKKLIEEDFPLIDFDDDAILDVYSILLFVLLGAILVAISIGSWTLTISIIIVLIIVWFMIEVSI